MDDVLNIAKNCRHFAMCKIDFLGKGVCASGLEKHYVSFYPEGRMDLYAALAENTIPSPKNAWRLRTAATSAGNAIIRVTSSMRCGPQKS